MLVSTHRHCTETSIVARPNSCSQPFKLAPLVLHVLDCALTISLRIFQQCRALRRDDDNTREICITLSSWRVVQHKLIPLILESRDDAVLVNTLLKIYVMLTMPLSKLAEEALSKPINPKAQGDVRDQQTRRRENATAQQVISFTNFFSNNS